MTKEVMQVAFRLWHDMYGVPFSHLFTELHIYLIHLEISSIHLEISTIQLEISPNELNISAIQ